jgi:hypothetical protein
MQQIPVREGRFSKHGQGKGTDMWWQVMPQDLRKVMRYSGYACNIEGTRAREERWRERGKEES